MVEINYREPVYAISVVAKTLKVCTATLRIWEKKGLVKPARRGKNRLYSKCDIDKLEHIKKLLQEKHMNIEGVRSVFATTQCWDVKKCGAKERSACPVYKKYGAS